MKVGNIVSFAGSSRHDAIEETVVVIIDDINKRVLIEHPDGFSGTDSELMLHPERKYLWVFKESLARKNKPDRKITEEIKKYLEKQAVKEQYEMSELANEFDKKTIVMPDDDEFENVDKILSKEIYPPKIRHFNLDVDFFITDDFEELARHTNRMLLNYKTTLETAERQIEIMQEIVAINTKPKDYQLQAHERNEIAEIIKMAKTHKILRIENGFYYYHNQKLISQNEDVCQFFANNAITLMYIVRDVDSKQNIIQGMKNIKKLTEKAFDTGILWVNDNNRLCFFEHIFDIEIDKKNIDKAVQFVYNNSDFQQQLLDLIDYAETLMDIKGIGKVTSLNIIKKYNTIDDLIMAVNNNDLIFDEVVNNLLAKKFKTSKK